jgi:hypothetical protein
MLYLLAVVAVIVDACYRAAKLRGLNSHGLLWGPLVLRVMLVMVGLSALLQLVHALPCGDGWVACAE